MPPRTIDNLGVDASTRYALDQQEFDHKILKEAGNIPRQAQVDVSQPSFTSEFDLLFDTAKRNSPWAQFAMPQNYNEQRKRLFTHQIIPSLGPQDKTESLEKKILAQLKEKAKEQDNEKERRKEDRSSWEDDQEKEEQEKEQKVLVQLLKNLLVLDKCMSDIAARRMQYQKG